MVRPPLLSDAAHFAPQIVEYRDLSFFLSFHKGRAFILTSFFLYENAGMLESLLTVGVYSSSSKSRLHGMSALTHLCYTYKIQPSIEHNDEVISDLRDKIFEEHLLLGSEEGKTLYIQYPTVREREYREGVDAAYTLYSRLKRS